MSNVIFHATDISCINCHTTSSSVKVKKWSRYNSFGNHCILVCLADRARTNLSTSATRTAPYKFSHILIYWCSYFAIKTLREYLCLKVRPSRQQPFPASNSRLHAGLLKQSNWSEAEMLQQSSVSILRRYEQCRHTKQHAFELAHVWHHTTKLWSYAITEALKRHVKTLWFE